MVSCFFYNTFAQIKINIWDAEISKPKKEKHLPVVSVKADLLKLKQQRLRKLRLKKKNNEEADIIISLIYGASLEIFH